jgi:hypothetical protein
MSARPSQHVAEAAKEGGFLGIGGVAVSEAEKALWPKYLRRSNFRHDLSNQREVIP